MPTPKPTSRAAAEDRATNLQRYVLGGFGPDATKTLGVDVVYPAGTDQGVTIATFHVDSTAEAGGLELFDWILEVDGGAVGLIRNRFYEPWKKYGRSGSKKVEVLASFVEPVNGGRLYYYPKMSFQTVAGEDYRILPDDFFTAAKPRTRVQAEDEAHNKARYVLGYGNFDKYSAWELGITASYSYGDGATIEDIEVGKAADAAGLTVGDLILEIDGTPIGVFNGRVYEVWRQYIYSKAGKVELLVAFDDGTGTYRYFYPTLQLDARATPI